MDSIITVRTASEKDAEALFELNNAFNGTGITTLSHIKESLKNNNEIVIIAYINDKAAGFCCTQHIKTFCYDRDYAEVEELFVKKPLRKAGVGKALMLFMESELNKREVFHFHLCTGARNKAARNLYEKMGYKRDGDIKYYK